MFLRNCNCYWNCIAFRILKLNELGIELYSIPINGKYLSHLDRTGGHFNLSPRHSFVRASPCITAFKCHPSVDENRMIGTIPLEANAKVKILMKISIKWMLILCAVLYVQLHVTIYCSARIQSLYHVNYGRVMCVISRELP